MVSLHNRRLLRFLPPSVQSFAATLEAWFVFAVGGIRLHFEEDAERFFGFVV